MKNSIVILFAIITLLLMVIMISSSYFNERLNAGYINFFKDKSMRISSTEFGNGQRMPIVYTCDGANINPPLSFSKIPAAAKSLVLIMDDPDAPGGTWVHWLLWNIKPDIKVIGENSVPASSTQGKTSFGKPGYGGPCPPSGVHHYYFKLYALDVPLNLPNDADKAALENAMSGHILDQTELIGLYSRK